MTTAAVAFVSAMALGAILTRAARSVGVRAGAIDHALVSRKIHRRPIPRVGGVAIVLSFYATLVVLLLLDRDAGQQLQAHARRAQGLLVGGVLIAALGLYDDFKGANASTKLVVQTGAAALMYGCGFRIDHLVVPLAPAMELGLLGAPLTILWIVGVTNAMNLIDGLDGLAAGVALVAALTTLTIASIGGDTVLALSAAALAGAIVGFLFFNLHPASIFMGDTGSMFLGFVLATTAIQASGRAPGAVAILVPAVALGLPIADTVLAIARRAARGAPIFLGDAGHIHHRLLQRGWSQRQAAFILYGACVVLGASALAVAFAPGGQALGVLLALSGAAGFLLRRLGFLGLGVTDELREQRRRNLMLRRLVRRAGEAARRAQTPEQVWEQVRRVAPVMGASSVGFRIGPAGGGTSYSHGFADAAPELLRVRYALTPERPGESCVELGWNDGRTRVDRDSEIVIELLCRQIAPVVKRIASVPSAPDASGGVRVGA